MNPSPPSTPYKARILIADDNRDSRAILAACLQDAGYEVETALDADEALVKGLAWRPDLFLLDVLMPRKNGFQLCRELRANPVLKQTPIILITGLDSKDDRFNGIDAGCDEFLAKPVAREALLGRVQTLLRLHAYRSQIDERKTFEAVLTHISDGILMLDPDWRIASLNAAAANLLKLNVESARGLTLLDLLFQNFQVSVPRRLLADPQEKTLRFEISRPEQANSAALTLSAHLDLIPAVEGEHSGFVLTLRDITQTKKETKLQRTFLSLISHKLRTPLACITEHTSLLQDGLLGELSEDQLNSVNRIGEQSGRLKELVEKMLGFIKLDESTWDHSADAFIINDALKKAANRVCQRYGDKKVEITYELPEGLYGLGIPLEHFGVIVESLIDNAIKFCDKPAVQVRVSYFRTKEGHHEISVTDNGPGIPHEEFERIFEEFYQIEKFFTGNVAGVGLGLALTRRLIEKAGGKVWVTSDLGKGSTFHFTRPVIGSVLRHAA